MHSDSGMMRWRMACTALALMFSSLALAEPVTSSERTWQSFNQHLRIGIQGTQVKGNSFETWFDGKYNTPDSKDLGGVYLGVALGVGESRFVGYDFAAVTRGSTSFDNQRVVLGQYFSLNEQARWSLALGGFRSAATRSASGNRRKNVEGAAALDAGLEWRPTPGLVLAPGWRVAALPGGGLHEFRLDSRLHPIDQFALEFSFSYLKWDTVDQVSWQIGPRWAF
jgi:hypothetical protein